MIDLHAHILPGLDDGSPDMDTSLRMLTIAEEEGVTDIAATTHFIPATWTQPADAVRKALDEFRARIDKESFSIRVTAVHEIHAGAGIVERLKKDEVLPYDTKCRYILLEMPHALVPAWMNQLVTELIQADITPIIAHPERNRDIKRAPKIVYDLVERGCLMQITAASVLG
ncbi:MAG: hypothetical protein JKX97_05520 [Candidatus Lindowbacteria bacterium]|nr:hypothetical protein [Candidatus Lindowbacteria bacterium]